jgi:hypothetical protein
MPLVIGVTGHRDLVPEETGLLKDAVKAFFENLRERFPHLPLAVISPLADGADQLVAEVAAALDIQLIALLPMPEKFYRKDFDGEVLTNYETLLAKSEVIELPLAEGLDASTRAISTESRVHQYVQMGGYLAAHSHILLALWDGKQTGKPGGTSEVVRFHQHDTMLTLDDTQPLSPIDFAEDESDLVHHIVCSRRTSGSPKQGLQAGDASWLTRDEINPSTQEMPGRYHTVFERMIEFNSDAAKLQPPHATSLIPAESLMHASSAVMGLAQLFEVADNMASRYQRLMFRALWLGYVFAITAGFSFIVYADIYSHDAMIYLYLSSIAVVLMVFMFEERQGWQRKYLDYRVLAEALRVQFYWALAGVTMESAHRFAHDSFHQRRELELGWIRNAMRYAGRSIDAELPMSHPEATEVVINSWIGDEQQGQSHYYSVKSEERIRKNKMTRALETSSFLLVILVAVTLVFLPGDLPFSNLLIALVGFMPFMVAVRQNYAHRTAERELISQYGYYYRIFTNAGQLLSRTDDVATKRGILRALGKAALDESSQWIMRQRESPKGAGAIMG